MLLISRAEPFVSMGQSMTIYGPYHLVNRYQARSFLITVLLVPTDNVARKWLDVTHLILIAIPRH